MMGIDSIRYLSIRGIITATRFLVRVAVLFLGDAVDCLMGEIEPSGEGFAICPTDCGMVCQDTSLHGVSRL